MPGIKIYFYGILSALSLFLALLNLSSAVQAQQMGTAARHAILMDAETGEVLMEKDATTPFPPASMSKLMTVYLAFEAIRDGTMGLNDTVVVSDEAWSNWRGRGSTMFLEARDEVTVGDLLRGIIVLSGNDACVVLAEHMAGTHDLFTEWMNAKGRDIGLTNSVFKNANGWPADGQYMTAKDLATLARRLSEDFPSLYPMFAEREFLYKQFSGNRFNRNPLLGRFPGADGLKTGHTEEAGYGLAASAVQDDDRLILVIAGLNSEGERMRESRRLLQYGFRNFSKYPLFGAGETVDYADVWLGQQATVPMVIEENIELILSRAQRSAMEVVIDYMNPIPAPISKGQQIGTLTIKLQDRDNIILPIRAGVAVEQVGGFGKLGAALEYYLFGSAGASAPNQ